MNWYDLEKQGWSWASGWNSSYGAYYAQAWRELSQRVQVDGCWQYRECFTEFDPLLEKAEANLQQRLAGLSKGCKRS